jgi:YD repeat-containing protein
MQDHFAGTTTYAYTDAGGLSTLTDRVGGVTSYVYNTNGQLQRMNYPNGTYAEYTYNDRSRLLTLNNKKSDGTIIAGFTYEYNPATCGKNGIRTAMTENILNPDGSRIQSRVEYQYDNNYRLSREIRTGDLPYDKIYTYDNAGNRLTKVENGTTTYYHYDAANKMVNYGPSNIAPYAGNILVMYDGAGNMTSVTNANGAVTDYTWDWMNKLVSADQGIINLAQFQYDGNGNRRIAISSSGQISFLYSAERLIEEEDGEGNMKAFYTIGNALLISWQVGLNTII